MFAIGLNASADHLQRLVELCQALEATGHDRLLLTESPFLCQPVYHATPGSGSTRYRPLFLKVSPCPSTKSPSPKA